MDRVPPLEAARGPRPARAPEGDRVPADRGQMLFAFVAVLVVVFVVVPPHASIAMLNSVTAVTLNIRIIDCNLS